MKTALRIFAVLPLLALGACATIVEGGDQTVTVVTDPAGATCTLTREGAAVGAVNPTPGSVVVKKSKEDVSIVCEKEGHLDSTAKLTSDFQTMTLGNVLIGGVIGVAVDSASGAMHEYPDSITVVLTPEGFASEEARDAFFDRRKARIEADSETAVAKLRANCVPDQQDCDELAAAAEKERDAELRALEEQRKAAKVEGR